VLTFATVFALTIALALAIVLAFAIAARAADPTPSDAGAIANWSVTR
jgi:hypothetical protein